MNTKDVRERVLQAVLAAEVTKGHLKWKVSDLARFTKVSRPLIYYHFGKTKKEILSECLNVFAENYYGFSNEYDESLKPNEIKQSLHRTRTLFLKNPSVAVFYQRARLQNSEIGDQLVAIEKRFQKKLKRSFPLLDDDQIKGLHALFHGMMTAPFLTTASFEAALAMIKLPAV